MKCVKCPLFHSWNNECDKGESCGLFGDGWDNDLQYEDDTGVVGCYVDRHYIEKADRLYTKHMEQEADAFEEWFEKIEPPKEGTE